MGRYKETWVFEGNTYKVGESLNDKWSENNIYPMVWFEGKLYRAIIKPKTKPRLNRVGLMDIYNPNKKIYWTTVDKVFQILKVSEK